MIHIFYNPRRDKFEFRMDESIRRDGLVVKTEAYSEYCIDRVYLLQALWEMCFEDPERAKFVGVHPENYMELNVKLDFTTSSLPDEDPEEVPDDSVMQLWSGD